jgi:hypothetical protein
MKEVRRLYRIMIKGSILPGDIPSDAERSAAPAHRIPA